MYKRDLVGRLTRALRRDLPFLHVITGPRQSGKTTAAGQAAEEWDGPTVFAAADAPLPPGPDWIHAQWELARARSGGRAKVLLVLDEVQKVRGWSETVKALWDEERRLGGGVRALLLGSSSLLVQKGLTESLAGRFLPYRCGHWSWPEMREAFGWSLDEWVYFGGYPGAAVLRGDEAQWRRYVVDSLVETVLARDVLQMASVAKPALLRHLFGLAVGHPAEILSYNKMLGALQDAGNTTTLAHYLRLLESAFLVSGLDGYKPGRGRRRAGSPKLIFWNDALATAFAGGDFAAARADRPWWGRLVENAVGAHLLNGLDPATHRLFYWRERDREADFVVKGPRGAWALEVKSGAGAGTPARGLAALVKASPGIKPLVVGTGGMPLEEFFASDPERLFS